MAKLSVVLTGTAGVYYVASQLAARGFHAAITHGNAPFVDILVGSLDGTSAVSLQVKTSSEALLTKGRGLGKKPDYYHWRVSEGSAPLNHSGLFFAFVDLNLDEFVNIESEKQALPDVLIVPSSEVHKVLASASKEGDKGWYWVTPQEWERRKNDWTPLEAYLAGKVSQ